MGFFKLFLAAVVLAASSFAYGATPCTSVVCKPSAKAPKSLFFPVHNPLQTDHTFPQNLNKSALSQVAHEVVHVNLLGAIAMTALYALPESATNWNKARIKSADLGEQWWGNVKKGPVVDRDDLFLNYSTHPYWGAAYNTWGISLGLTQEEADTLSFLMSTFFWEYGVEAIAETPSIQDLIVTPLLGNLLARWSQHALSYLESKKRLGLLGRIAKVVLNPIGEANNLIKGQIRKLEKGTGLEVDLHFKYRMVLNTTPTNQTHHTIYRSDYDNAVPFLELVIGW